VDSRDITSTLVDLAVRGYVSIREAEDKGLIFNSTDYELKLEKDRSEWAKLSAHEREMITKIFGDSDQRMLSGLRQQFYTAIPTIKQSIKRELKMKGMYTVDPDSANGYIAMGVLLIAAPVILLQWFGLVDFLKSGVAWMIGAGVLTLVIIIFFARHMSAKSLRGMRTAVHILGFQEFMERVESDRLQRMPPDTFEKFLPFAMALGVERRWAKAFEGIVQNPPNWYHSSSGRMFNPVLFTNNVSSMSRVASAAFTEAPRSSSSGSGFSSGGGFSGGGFSGGGFGGGGGGAF
jgi:uncharacterized membrane protein